MKKILIIVSALLLGFSSITMTRPVSANPLGHTQVNRLAGLTRYETATKIADELAVQLGINFSAGEQFQTVVLASGNNWPDAISGAPLAKQNNAPLLLLDSSPESSQTTWDYLGAHVSKNANVLILGGTAVVPSSFSDYLVGLGFQKNNIKQLGGLDRNETSLLIAKQLVNTTGTVSLVSDSNFYDALTATSDAVSAPYPILLVSDAQGLTSEQRAFCDTTKASVTNGHLFIVGELGASNIYSGASIIKGTNRYDTNSAMEEWHNRDANILLATGVNYPDALAGSVLAGQLNGGGFVVLTDSQTLQSETIAELNDLAFNEQNPQLWSDPSQQFYPTLYVLGGEGVISDDLLTQVTQILNSEGQSKR